MYSRNSINPICLHEISEIVLLKPNNPQILHQILIQINNEKAIHPHPLKMHHDAYNRLRLRSTHQFAFARRWEKEEKDCVCRHYCRGSAPRINEMQILRDL